MLNQRPAAAAPAVQAAAEALPIGEPHRRTLAYGIGCKVGRPNGPGHPRFAKLMRLYALEDIALRARAV